jgi:F0F1-type ATP synthase assembly protein I
MIKLNHISNSFGYLQKIIKQSGPAMNASYTLIAAVILLGTIGYFIDKWLNTAPIFLLIGLLFGIIVGFYEIAKLIWTRKEK